MSRPRNQNGPHRVHNVGDGASLDVLQRILAEVTQQNRNLLTALSSSADRVLTKAETAELCGISTDTLDRLVARGQGPPRTRLSPRRVGHRLSGILKYLADREAAGDFVI
jgi:predicted DNA-binding transcriptional regulator AlpA